MNNIILATDSYKLTHWNQYPKDTEVVYSYFESRKGAKYDETVFFGLQYIIQKYLEGSVVSWNNINQAKILSQSHFGNGALFNSVGWEYIWQHHKGRLPLRIKAVPEGTVVPAGNVLMTVENTDPKCYWLTNAVESLLTHVWYPSTVATLSREVKKDITERLVKSADSLDALPFMLHDFGYRGASSHESAAIGGAGHLVNFMGTDTLPAMLLAVEHYSANLDTLAYSVPATEHSVMTARGEDGEFEVVQQLLEEHPTGILSVVADSYDIYRFVTQIGLKFKKQIMERDGTFVVRPDSVTSWHRTPEQLTTRIVSILWHQFGGTVNSKGYKVLDQHVRVLWGDGIDPEGINKIMDHLIRNGFSVENMVFGMGGGLLQKVNRDIQRFAFKSSAQKRSGTWHEVYKRPLDASKASKKGRLRLVQENGVYKTVTHDEAGPDREWLGTVFQNGVLCGKQVTFEDVRENAKL